MRRYGWLAMGLLLLGLWAWQQRPHAPPAQDRGEVQQPAPATQQASLPDADDTAARWPGFLPPQALDTLRRIDNGGPFEHRQDGGIFQNRERLLPPRPRGYYREYTVRTPGARDRGARRIIGGGDPPVEYFYTDDHYRSFRRFVPAGTQAGR